MRVLLTGASSQIGVFLIPRLLHDGHEIFAISRRRRDGDDGAKWLTDDVATPQNPWPPVDALIHIAPLRLLPALLPDFLAKGGRRVICFGTTSRYSKAISGDTKEQAFAAEQIAAESKLAELCEAANAAWTLFRPTLIYGAGMDRNVTVIARLIRRFGLFPLFGEASGKRQPVHADDLAAACVAALAEPKSFNAAYDLAGGRNLDLPRDGRADLCCSRTDTTIPAGAIGRISRGDVVHVACSALQGFQRRDGASDER